MLNKFITTLLYNRPVTILLLITIVAAGITVAPFDILNDYITKNPVPVDAIPDIGENQQIIATEWMGRSPKDVQEQITYPLTTTLLGIPKVKTVRSTSMFGMSFVYIIFDDDAEFYWSRSRIVEKLNALPNDLLPQDVKPTLGPDATALGQIFWYTLEGRNPLTGEPTSGWNPHELRTLQDFHVKYHLATASGVAEVASAGGFLKEYQVEINPNAMKAANVNVMDVMNAVQKNNLDIGAETIEVNMVEYLVRGLGYIQSIEDIENAVITTRENGIPVRIKDVAVVTTGPATRRGGLDKEGVEAVGGVVVARYGANPLEVINNVKEKIKEMDAGMPTKILDDGQISKVTVVPFYDRTGLIKETIGTLETALEHEILICIIVVIVLVFNLKASVIISSLLPVAVLATFIIMKYTHVDANIVALSGIAIAIGVMVDVGVVIVENILRNKEMLSKRRSRVKPGDDEELTFHDPMQVAGTIQGQDDRERGSDRDGGLTSHYPMQIAGTIQGQDDGSMGYLPLDQKHNGEGYVGGEIPDQVRNDGELTFHDPMQIAGTIQEHNQQSKNELLRIIEQSVKDVAKPLTTGMLTTVISFLPVFAMQAQEGKLFGPLAYTKTFALVAAFVIGFAFLPTIAYYVLSFDLKNKMKIAGNIALVVAGGVITALTGTLPAVALILVGVNNLTGYLWKNKQMPKGINIGITLVTALYYLASQWLPAGTEAGITVNVIIVCLFAGVILATLWWMVKFYETILRWCLNNRWKFLLIPITTLVAGILVWKNMGEEFMPSLNEGSFLLMPTNMPHAGVEQNLKTVQTLDRRISQIPEIYSTVGKWGRVNSALDPAPTQMFENTINYRPEYALDQNGHRLRFKTNDEGAFVLKNGNTHHPTNDGFKLIPTDSLTPDPNGKYFRQWRNHIRNSDDIWQEIVNQAHLPGVTSAPKLQPIEARLVMLSTGMRAPMGIKIAGPTLEKIEQAGLLIENALKDVQTIRPATVFYDRAVGAPYLEIKLDRIRMARYGITVNDLQDVIGTAIGGMTLTTTVEGRERFNVRIRYPRELRNQPEEIENILVPTNNGNQIPLKQVADIQYEKGAQMIQSENTFLVGYVIFDKVDGHAEVDVVHDANQVLDQKIKDGSLTLPDGVSYKFAGNYEQQERAAKRLMIVIPISLLLILLILYAQFKTVTAAMIHFSGVFVAFAGGFILVGLYGQNWFMDFTVMGCNMRELFQVHTVNLSIAVWVGFIALFGIATDDGVLMGSYIHQVFTESNPKTTNEIRNAVVIAGLKRVRPAAMTTATTLIALLPVLTSTGKGADIMVPMAIPTFGGMIIQSMTMFVVPVLQCWWRESVQNKINKGKE